MPAVDFHHHVVTHAERTGKTVRFLKNVPFRLIIIVLSHIFIHASHALLAAEKTHDGFVEFRRIAACREMIAADKAKLRIRDRRCDQLGMAPFHEIARSGDDKRRRGDFRKALRRDVRLIHHKPEKLRIFLRVGAFFPQSGGRSDIRSRSESASCAVFRRAKDFRRSG